MKRRQFIGLSAYLAAAISIPILESCGGNSIEDAVASPSTLIRILDKNAIVIIGKKYLEKFPAEKSSEQLIEVLLGKDFSVGKDVAIEQLDKKCIDDFNTNNTVMVNGWVLSRTEARQCALFTLLQS